MNKLNRRSLVASLAAIAPLACLGPAAQDGMQRPGNLALEGESLKVHAHWMRTQAVSPEDYLKATGVALDDALAVKQQIVRDFETNNLYLYNGLVASKCEMAIMACYGQVLGASLG